MSDKQLAKIEPVPLDQLQIMAKAIADSGMFGLNSESQALSLMLLCQAEGIHPAMAMRRYHIIENKPAMRADAMQGEFEKNGAILWHERSETECAATFFKEKRPDDDAVKRAKDRYKAMVAGESTADFAALGELTIIRTIADAIEKKVATSWSKDKQDWVLKKNWRQSPRQMLHARCLTEGVRAIDPGLIAGVYTEDEIMDTVDVELDQLPASEQAEERVRAATANRLEDGATEAELVETHWEDVIVHFGENMKGKRLGDLEPSQIGWLQKHWNPGNSADDINLKKVVSSLQSTPINGDSAEVNETNYKTIVCHIGKAEGQMLGRKVGGIHPNILQWLNDHYGPDAPEPQWGNPPNNKDKRLKCAVEIALEVLQRDENTGEKSPTQFFEAKTAGSIASDTEDEDSLFTNDTVAKPVTFDWREVACPFECRIKGMKLGKMKENVLRAIQTQLIGKFKIETPEQKLFVTAYELAKKDTGLFMDREQLRAALIEKAQDLILTEPQLVTVLQENGLLEKQETLHDANEKVMRYVLQNWHVLKGAVEERNKPKADPDKKPKRKGKK